MPIGMNPEEEKELDDGILGAIDEGLELSGDTPAPVSEPSGPVDDPVKVEPVEPTAAVVEEEIDPDAPPLEPIKFQEDEDPEKKTDDDPDKKKTEEELAVGDSDTPPGTPVPKVEDDPAALTPELTPEPKPSDEFGELEADAKPATKERFATMKTRFDEVVTERDRISGQNDAWMDTIKRTGASPVQLGASLSYLEDINTGTPESLERAYQTMQGEMAVLAKALGKKAPGHDPLEAYPDLQYKVNEGEIDEEDALEIAGSRTRNDFAKNNPEPPAPQPVNNNEAGTKALSALGTRLRAADPLYDQKLPVIKQIVEDVVTSGVAPEHWAALVEKGYNRIKMTAPAPVTPKITPNPIRPGAGGRTGEFAKEPGNINEAVDMALDQL